MPDTLIRRGSSLSAALAIVCVCQASAQGLTSEQAEQWRRLTWSSTAIVLAVVEDPRILVIWPEKRVSSSVLRPDGTTVVLSPRTEDYLAGAVARIRIESVYKAFNDLREGGGAELYFPAPSTGGLVRGERYLFFLRNPIEFDALMIERYGDWDGLQGTVLHYRPFPHTATPPDESFDVANAYSAASTPMLTGIRSIIADTPENAGLIATVLAQIHAATERVSPTLCISSPSSESLVGGVVTVRAEATDDVGVEDVSFFLDGASLGPPLTEPPFQVQWDTRALAEGSRHRLGATAHDFARNEATASVGVTVRNAPRVSVGSASADPVSISPASCSVP